jgi:hypothetical protein
MNTNVKTEKFLRRHRMFIFGITCGFGMGLVCVEAFQQEKDPIICIGGGLLALWGDFLYRHRDDSK